MMGKFRIHGGGATLNGRNYRDGSVVDFDGLPPVGFEPMDEAARRQKHASITDDMLESASHYPQRTMLLARSLGGNDITFDRARRSILEWMAEKLQSVPAQSGCDQRFECGGSVMPASTHAAAQPLNETVDHSSVKHEVVKDQKSKAKRDHGHDEDHGHQQEFHVAYPTRRISPTASLSAGTVTNS